MMNTSSRRLFCCLIVWLRCCHNVHAAAVMLNENESRMRKTSRRQTQTTLSSSSSSSSFTDIICQVEWVIMDLGDGHEQDLLTCELISSSGPDDDVEDVAPGSYRLQGLYPDFESQLLDQLRTNPDQHLELHISQGRVVEDAIWVVTRQQVTLVHSAGHNDGRQLRKPPSTGSLRTVVIRVSTSDATPSFTAQQLQQYWFDHSLSPRGQFERCSNHQLTLQPDDFGGVLDILLSDKVVQGATPNLLVNWAEQQVNQELSVSHGISNIRSWSQLLVFVLPPGTGGWVAYATVSGKQSTFNDRWGGYLGAMMHELGHNLSLRHSYKDGVEYAGRSGYMGLAPAKTLVPQQCYNARNHYQLHWFEPYELELDTFVSHALIKVAAFVDVDRISPGDDHVVVIKFGDLYLQYNRATRHNKETFELANQLVVIRGLSRSTDQLGGLADQQEASYAVTDGPVLNIKVCQVLDGQGVAPDAMLISIGTGVPHCAEIRDFTEAPVPNLPTGNPTLGPSVSPSFGPSPSPTRRPTTTPTTFPTTRNPTLAPSITPTGAPSTLPSELASEPPSFYPTRTPTTLPSFGPTLDPSQLPTILPTTNEPTAQERISASPSPSPYIEFPTTRLETTKPTVSPSYEPTLDSDEPSSFPSLFATTTQPTLMVVETSLSLDTVEKQSKSPPKKEKTRSNTKVMVSTFLPVLWFVFVTGGAILACLRWKRRRQRNKKPDFYTDGKAYKFSPFQEREDSFTASMASTADETPSHWSLGSEDSFSAEDCEIMHYRLGQARRLSSNYTHERSGSLESMDRIDFLVDHHDLENHAAPVDATSDQLEGSHLEPANEQSVSPPSGSRSLSQMVAATNLFSTPPHDLNEEEEYMATRQPPVSSFSPYRTSEENGVNPVCEPWSRPKLSQFLEATLIFSEE